MSQFSNGLACPVGPEHAEHPALPGHQVHAVQRRRLAEALDQARGLDRVGCCRVISHIPSMTRAAVRTRTATCQRPARPVRVLSARELLRPDVVPSAWQAGLSVPEARLRLVADSRLSVRDRELFLAEPHIAALSVSAGEGRGPLIVPIWYQYAPGGEAWVLTPAGSKKARLIEAAGRFTLMVERVLPTVRYVSVEGPVTRTIPGTDELLREITVRYLPPEKVPAYLEFAETELGEQVAIYLRPERWLTADLGPGAVPPRVA